MAITAVTSLVLGAKKGYEICCFRLLCSAVTIALAAISHGRACCLRGLRAAACFLPGGTQCLLMHGVPERVNWWETDECQFSLGELASTSIFLVWSFVWLHLIKSLVGSITAIVFSGANSFPLIRNLLMPLLANLVQTAPWAVKSNGKCGPRWHSQSLSWKGVTGEAGRLEGKDSCSKEPLHVSGPNCHRCLWDRVPEPIGAVLMLSQVSWCPTYCQCRQMILWLEANLMTV